MSVRVLVACERSGRVRDAFLARGHDATSCDVEDTDSPGPHVKGDVTPLLRERWDLVIAFPPCTYLAVAGARWWPGRERERVDALHFVGLIWHANTGRVAIENPVGQISTAWRKPDQIVQPWMFGHGETKATCLWLRGLPRLAPTDVVDGREARVHRMSPGPNRSRLRSLTYPGIARAMAEQWGTP